MCCRCSSVAQKVDKVVEECRCRQTNVESVDVEKVSDVDLEKMWKVVPIGRLLLVVLWECQELIMLFAQEE